MKKLLKDLVDFGNDHSMHPLNWWLKYPKRAALTKQELSQQSRDQFITLMFIAGIIVGIVLGTNLS
jgi:hypothetical protein